MVEVSPEITKFITGRGNWFAPLSTSEELAGVITRRLKNTIVARSIKTTLISTWQSGFLVLTAASKCFEATYQSIKRDLAVSIMQKRIRKFLNVSNAGILRNLYFIVK